MILEESNLPEDEFDIDDIDFDIEGEEVPIEGVISPKEEIEKNSPVEDGRIAQLEADLESAREEARREREDAQTAWEDADKIRTSTIQQALQQWGNDIAREQKEVLAIQQAHARATADGDTDKVVELIAKYDEKQRSINQIQSNINNAQHQLANKPQRKVKEPVIEAKKQPEKNAAMVMADRWTEENPWYNDPTHKEKRQLVDKLVKEAISDKYNPATLKFWAYIDRKVEEDTKKKETPRRTPPAVRPVINQVGNQPVSNNKKRADAEILLAADKALERRGIGKTHPDFIKYRKSYYKTYSTHAAKMSQSDA